MAYSDQQNTHSNIRLRHANIKKMLASIPTYAITLGISRHEKQLVEMPTLIYHKQTKELLLKNHINNPKKKKLFISKRIARELWTNFCAQGRNTPMLRHLHAVLRAEYGEDLQFIYPNESIELVIMKKTKNSVKPIVHAEQIKIVDKAWQISQEIVSKYIR